MTNLNIGGTPEKPEWFQMAEADASPEPTTSSLSNSKRLPLLALLATGAILTGGAVFANVTENEVANAESATAQEFVPATQAVLGDSSTSGATTGTETGITPPQAPANPNGIQPPRPGGGDDDDDGFEDGQNRGAAQGHGATEQADTFAVGKSLSADCGYKGDDPAQ